MAEKVDDSDVDIPVQPISERVVRRSHCGYLDGAELPCKLMSTSRRLTTHADAFFSIHRGSIYSLQYTMWAIWLTGI